MEPWEIAILGVASGLGLMTLGFYFVTGVPPVSSRRDEIRDVVELLEEAEFPWIREGGTIYELGCGVGSLAVALAAAFPRCQVVGVEVSPVVFVLAWLRALPRPNLRVRWGSFLRRPLKDADAVTAYLMIRPMPGLAEHLDAELRPGTAVVTVTFWFRERVPRAVKKGPGIRGDVALYRWPGRR